MGPLVFKILYLLVIALPFVLAYVGVRTSKEHPFVSDLALFMAFAFFTADIGMTMTVFGDPHIMLAFLSFYSPVMWLGYLGLAVVGSIGYFVTEHFIPLDGKDKTVYVFFMILFTFVVAMVLFMLYVFVHAIILALLV